MDNKTLSHLHSISNIINNLENELAELNKNKRELELEFNGVQSELESVIVFDIDKVRELKNESQRRAAVNNHRLTNDKWLELYKAVTDIEYAIDKKIAQVRQVKRSYEIELQFSSSTTE